MSPNTLPNGVRLAPLPGNVGLNTRWAIVDPPAGRLTVSVHAIDGGYRASQSSAKLTLEIGDNQSPFETADVVLPGVAYGQASWADADEDGDKDIVIVGGSAAEGVSAIFLNEGGGRFVSTDAAIPSLAHATTAWGDYDFDGDEDLFVSGEGESGYVAQVLRNDEGLLFSDIHAGIEPVEDAAASWVDIDGDNDLDLVVSGLGRLGPQTSVYKNTGGDTFGRSAVNIPGVLKGSHDWADFDEDGDLDLLLTGSDGIFPLTMILDNKQKGLYFRDAGAALLDVFDGEGDWVDFNGDGDLDIMITGHALDGVQTRMFMNSGGGSFLEFPTPLPGVRQSSTSWGDFDGDSDDDLALSGWDGGQRITKVYGNAGDGTFSEVFTNMRGVSVGSVEWSDADGDGDLDLLTTGESDEAARTNVYLYDPRLGSGEGDAGKVATSTAAPFNSDEVPLGENEFLFKQSYPNPFNMRATIHFAVGRMQPVRIALYNILGQLVDVPFERTVTANEMTAVTVMARDLSSGAYVLRIEGESFSDVQTVVVNK